MYNTQVFPRKWCMVAKPWSILYIWNILILLSNLIDKCLGIEYYIRHHFPSNCFLDFWNILKFGCLFFNGISLYGVSFFHSVYITVPLYYQLSEKVWWYVLMWALLIYHVRFFKPGLSCSLILENWLKAWIEAVLKLLSLTWKKFLFTF